MQISQDKNALCLGALLSQTAALKSSAASNEEEEEKKEGRMREVTREVRTFQFSSVTCERIPTEPPGGDGADVRETERGDK